MSSFALAALLLVTADADARRRYYRHRASEYSPPASAMAIDLYTGRILYSKNANEPRYPASLTKVMTLYLLFDALRDGKISMNTQLRVSAHAAGQSPTKLDLSEGDTISVADAIGAIVTKSANDMAVAVAEALAGSEEEFAKAHDPEGALDRHAEHDLPQCVRIAQLRAADDGAGSHRARQEHPCRPSGALQGLRDQIFPI